MAMVLDYDDEATSKCSNCHRAIPSSNICLHYAHCSRILQKCEICGIMIPKKQAEEHYLSIHAPVACSLCSELVEPEILEVHREENCPRRMVSCECCEFSLPAAELLEHQVACSLCGEVVEWEILEVHREENCPRRMVSCEYCKFPLPATELLEHQVACSLCSEVVQREILEVHREENCPRRLASCEYCEFPSPAAELLEHQEVCGNRTEYCNLCGKYVTLCNRVLHAAEHSRNASPLERERNRRNQPPLPPPKGRWQSLVEKRHLLLATTGIAVVLGSLFFSPKKSEQ